MTAVVGRGVISIGRVIIGVDTHQEGHVAVAIDQQGVRLAERHAPANSYGYRELERWSQQLGEVRAYGVEGTGSYGAGLARFYQPRLHRCRSHLGMPTAYKGKRSPQRRWKIPASVSSPVCGVFIAPWEDENL